MHAAVEEVHRRRGRGVESVDGDVRGAAAHDEELGDGFVDRHPHVQHLAREHAVTVALPFESWSAFGSGVTKDRLTFLAPDASAGPTKSTVIVTAATPAYLVGGARTASPNPPVLLPLSSNETKMSVAPPAPAGSRIVSICPGPMATRSCSMYAVVRSLPYSGTGYDTSIRAAGSHEMSRTSDIVEGAGGPYTHAMISSRPGSAAGSGPLLPVATHRKLREKVQPRLRERVSQSTSNNRRTTVEQPRWL